MSRTRLTWSDRSASPPPAIPSEPGHDHPASYPDPGPNDFQTGDTSSWNEDVRPGPYPNSAPPALPGTDEPQGHPATDPAHYFPPGVGKQAAAQLKAAVQQKAARCVRLAELMLGKNATWSAVEDQALDLMNLSERQIQATAERLGNYTLTTEEGRKAEDAKDEAAPADDKKAGEDEKKDAEPPADEKKAGADEPKDEDKKAGDDEDADKADVETAAKKAAYHTARANLYWKRLAKLAGEVPEAFKKQWDKGDGDKKDDADKKDDEDKAKKEAAEAEALLASMLAGSKTAGDDDEDEEAEGLLASMLKEEEAKKAGADPKPEDEKKDEGADKKAAEDEAALLASLLGGGAPMDTAVVADDVLFEDDDPMGLMDGFDMVDLSPDDMSTLYGNTHLAGEDEPKDEPKDEGADKKASQRTASQQTPRARTASQGVKVLGATPTRTPTGGKEIDKLSGLWETAPNVDKFFG